MITEEIPFLDLISIHQENEKEYIDIFTEAVRTGRFIGGPAVESFEHDFASFCSAKYCIGVNSGTDALHFAFRAAGIKQGEIIITVPNTFIATVEGISMAGAEVVFVDIDKQTYTMDPALLRAYLKEKCKYNTNTKKTFEISTGRRVAAVIPVHLYGQIADMDAIEEIANEYNLLVFEDACQAHGAEYFSKKRNAWLKAGSIGIAAAFSFYPGKNLGAFGEGGAVTTNDERIAETIKMLRDHGQKKKYIHELEGYNGRLDAIQAKILSVKLKNLHKWNELRRNNAHLYNKLLKDLPDIALPFEPEWSKPVYHLYVVRHHSRDKMMKYLTEKKINTALHYPVPLHMQNACSRLQLSTGTFPISEQYANQIVSLPMYPQLTCTQIEYIAEQIRIFCLMSEMVEMK